MKRKFILILLTLITCSLFAQPVTTLEGVCVSLAAHPNTTGDFTQTKTIQTNGRKLKSTGKYIICPEGIVWKTERPVPSSLILTKDKMIQVAANGKKSVMDGKDNQIFSNISEILSSVFSGNAASIRKNFNCDFQMKNDGEWSVSLEPKDSTIASVMNTLVLSGTCTNSNDAEMKSLVISETSGNTISYEFTNQKYPEELSADEKQNFIVE
jgi:hypothetical protein